MLLDTIGNPTVKRVKRVKRAERGLIQEITPNQRVDYVILKNTTSLSVGFLLNTMIKPGFLRYFLGHPVPEFFSSQLIFWDTL